MSHSVFDERGKLLQQTESEFTAFALAFQRMRAGKLTTVSMSWGGEVMFAPIGAYGARAETALEHKARVAPIVAKGYYQNHERSRHG